MNGAGGRAVDRPVRLVMILAVESAMLTHYKFPYTKGLWDARYLVTDTPFAGQ